MTKIKLCGFTDKKTVDLAAKHHPDFLGFVFYKNSPRNITPKQAAKITSDLPKTIKKVAVIVDATDAEIFEIINEFHPDFLQLHGQETPKRAKIIKNEHKIPIIKAILVKNEQDLHQIADFEDIVDMFLFDSKIDGQKGGTGKNFDWNILKNLKTNKKCPKDWILSGGINAKNAKNAIKTTGAKIIDLSSAIEESRGIKSPKLIAEFMDLIS